jgi:predicted transcriptional regulator
MVIPGERFMVDFFDQFLEVLEESEFLIGKIKVKKEDLADLFEKTAKDLGIKIELVKRLPAIEFAKKDFNSFLKNNLKK